MKANEFQQATNTDRPSLSFDFLETRESITLAKFDGAIKDAPFIILWLVGWTCGCLFLSLQSYLNPGVIIFLLMFVFWIFWGIIVAALIWMRFGIETLHVDNNGLKHSRTAFVPLTRRNLARDEMILFREHQTEDADGDMYFCIELMTTGKPLRMLPEIEDDQRDWLIHQLNEFCGLKHSKPGNWD